MAHKKTRAWVHSPMQVHPWHIKRPELGFTVLWEEENLKRTKLYLYAIGRGRADFHLSNMHAIAESTSHLRPQHEAVPAPPSINVSTTRGLSALSQPTWSTRYTLAARHKLQWTEQFHAVHIHHITILPRPSQAAVRAQTVLYFNKVGVATRDLEPLDFCHSTRLKTGLFGCRRCQGLSLPGLGHGSASQGADDHQIWDTDSQARNAGNPHMNMNVDGKLHTFSLTNILNSLLHTPWAAASALLPGPRPATPQEPAARPDTHSLLTTRDGRRFTRSWLSGDKHGRFLEHLDTLDHRD
ncbi:hypothetical protein RRG08_014967 [Elysia crispata]|uniref:Uncharacterized protein n=1 Tax=Elysia crispata TaxID=231223 RepID=A0AAE0ZX83_9GAST|nr:hypothetical protein RRG08_014967 [Elysia crispata]